MLPRGVTGGRGGVRESVRSTQVRKECGGRSCPVRRDSPVEEGSGSSCRRKRGISVHYSGNMTKTLTALATTVITTIATTLTAAVKITSVTQQQ